MSRSRLCLKIMIKAAIHLAPAETVENLDAAMGLKKVSPGLSLIVLVSFGAALMTFGAWSDEPMTCLRLLQSTTSAAVGEMAPEVL